MESSTTLTKSERRYRSAARTLFLATAAIVGVIGASWFVDVRGRGIFPAKRGAFGEDGWCDRGVALGSGSLAFASTSYLGFQGDHSGVPPFKVRTGVWLELDPDERLDVRWMPRVDLVSGIWWTLPLWTIALPLLVGGVACQQAAQRRRRTRLAGLCRSCGYDLRASPGRCPECGVTVALAPTL